MLSLGLPFLSVSRSPSCLGGQHKSPEKQNLSTSLTHPPFSPSGSSMVSVTRLCSGLKSLTVKRLTPHSSAEAKMVRGGVLGWEHSFILCGDSVTDFLGPQCQVRSWKEADASGLCSQVSLVSNQVMAIKFAPHLCTPQRPRCILLNTLK